MFVSNITLVQWYRIYRQNILQRLWPLTSVPRYMRYSRMNEESAQVTAMRGRRDDWRTQTDSNAVVPRFSRRAATLNVPTPLVEGAHSRSCRFVCVAFRPSPFLAILRRARSVHRDARRRDVPFRLSLFPSLTSPLFFSRSLARRVFSSLWYFSQRVKNETGVEERETRVGK